MLKTLKGTYFTYLLVGSDFFPTVVENDVAAVGPDRVGLDVALLGVPHVDAAGVRDDVTHSVADRHERQVVGCYAGHR